MKDLENIRHFPRNDRGRSHRTSTVVRAAEFGHQFHRAGYILISPWHIIENGYLRVENGIIVEVGSKKSGMGSSTDSARVMDHGPGVIMPQLVNAHTHFELSALHNRIPFERGFNDWVRELLIQREQCGETLLKQNAQKAIAESVACGTGLIGEISTLGITRDMLASSALSGIWFQEFLGGEYPLPEALSTFSPPFDGPSISIENDDSASSIYNTMVFSMAGHAPHTSSPDLLRFLKHQTLSKQLPFSIHVAESRDETEFITTGQGGWAAFLRERGIDASDWPLPSKSPVQYLDALGILDNLTLAVHLLNADETDFEIMARTEAIPVLCPRSNMNLHGRLPDLPLMLKYGSGKLKPALGTDSLASTESLNLFDEMAFIARHFPQVQPSEIFAMATIHGARALGYGGVAGSLEIGKIASFLYLPLSNNRHGSRRSHRCHCINSEFRATIATGNRHMDIEQIILEIITHHE